MEDIKPWAELTVAELREEIARQRDLERSAANASIRAERELAARIRAEAQTLIASLAPDERRTLREELERVK